MGSLSLRAAGAVCFALLLPVILSGCAARQDVTGPVVKSLRFRGNSAVSSRDLSRALATQSTGWWPFAKKHVFDPIIWAEDLKRVVRVYESRGYHDATVVSEHVDSTKAGEVRLEVEVREGQRTHVASLAVTGLDGLSPPDRAAAQDRLPLAPGGAFTEQGWASTKDRVRTTLRE